MVFSLLATQCQCLCQYQWQWEWQWQWHWQWHWQWQWRELHKMSVQQPRALVLQTDEEDKTPMLLPPHLIQARGRPQGPALPRDWCAPPLTWAHVYKMVHRHTTVLQLQQPLHSELLVPLELSLLQTRRSARFASMPEAHGAAVDRHDALHACLAHVQASDATTPDRSLLPLAR